MKLLTVFIIVLYISLSFSQKNPHFVSNRTTIVHLFEWKWDTIADECEQFLRHKGYGAVQVSPANENIIAPNRPWWERYQPVSYKILTRSGDEKSFVNMTRRCNAVGVRIYVDVVVNHMAAMNGVGTAGNKADFDNKSYPGVPFGINDFHETCFIDNYNNADNVRNCQLGGLRDLNQGLDYVREKITQFLNHLIDLGVAGFRIDAAKHMWPQDLQKIYNNLKNLNIEHGFPEGSRPFIYQEVIDLGNEAIKETDYSNLGVVTEFRYAKSISNVFQGNDKLTYLDSWGKAWGFLSNGDDALVFVDNHDTQRDSGKLTYKSPKRYKMAVAFMLAHPYGIARVMSSYYFNNRDEGPPQDKEGNLIPRGVKPDDTCLKGFVCEHRWRQIYNMVQFRNVVQGTPVTNFWSNGDQQIAFCRGNRGFAAFNNWGNLSARIQTCLPTGNYCDIISGNVINGKCAKESIFVDETGFALISLPSDKFDGVLALHINSKIS